MARRLGRCFTTQIFADFLLEIVVNKRIFQKNQVRKIPKMYHIIL